MRNITTTALVAGAVLVGAAFGPSIVGAQTDDAPVEDSVTVDERVAEHHHHRGHHGFRAEAAADIADMFGMTAEELRTELRGGATIAEIAEAEGVDVADVVAAIEAQMAERLADAVENGHLSEAEAAEIAAGAADRATDIVNGVRPERVPEGPRDGMRPGARGPFSADNLAERLDAAVEAGRMTEAQAAEMLAAAEAFAATGELPEGFEGMGPRGMGHRGHHGAHEQPVDADA